MGIFEDNQYQNLLAQAQERDSEQKMDRLMQQALESSANPQLASLDDEIIRRPVTVPAGNYQFHAVGTIVELNDTSIKLMIEKSTSVSGYDNLCDHLPDNPILHICCCSDQLSASVLYLGARVDFVIADCCGPVIELIAMSPVTKVNDIGDDSIIFSD